MQDLLYLSLYAIDIILCGFNYYPTSILELSYMEYQELKFLCNMRYFGLFLREFQFQFTL